MGRFANLLRRPWFLVTIDWLVVLFLLLIAIGLSLVFPFAQQFRLDDPSISLPLITDGYSFWWDGVVDCRTISKDCVDCCVGCYTSACFDNDVTRQNVENIFQEREDLGSSVDTAPSGYDLPSRLRCFFGSAAIYWPEETWYLTPFPVSDLKLNSDFLARCAAPKNTPTDQWVSIDVCTNPDLLRDGLCSFPSEDASVAFAGLGLLALTVAGETGMFFRFGGNATRLWTGWLALGVLLPLGLAATSSLSKLHDNRCVRYSSGPLILGITRVI